MTLLFLINASHLLFAQQTVFSKVFYNAGSTNGTSVLQSVDKGYMVAGTNSNNAFVMKIDSAGTYLWSRDFGNSSNTAFNKIIATNDSCFVLTGKIQKASGFNTDIFCVKITASGDTLWSKAIGSSTSEEANSIVQTSDHGYILTGYKNNSTTPYNNILVVKLDSTGNLQWKKTITIGDNENVGYSVKQLPDGGYVILAFAESMSPSLEINSVLIKFTSSGAILWSKKYNRPTPAYSFPTEMEITPDGILSYLSVGYQTTLLKTDFSGTVLWSKNYTMQGSNMCTNCPSPKIHSTSDKGYVFVNGSAQGIGGQDMLKVDSVGNVVFAQNLFLYPIDVIESNDKGFLVLGNGPIYGVKSSSPTYNPQIGIIKTDSSGNGFDCINLNNWVTTSIDSLIGSTVSTTEINGGISTAVYPVLSNSSILEYIGCVSFLGAVGESDPDNSISISPNPFTYATTISFTVEQKNTTIRIIDVLGKELNKFTLRDGEKDFVFDGEKLRKGIYFIQIQTANRVLTKKIVVH